MILEHLISFKKKPIDIFCSDHVFECLKREYRYIFDDDFNYPGIPKVNRFNLENTTFSYKDLKIQPIQVMHYKLPVFGFRIEKFCYITDASFIDLKEKEKLRNLDVLVINALRKEKHISHFNLEEALNLIKELKPKQAYLTHISHLLGSHEEISKELPKKRFPFIRQLKPNFIIMRIDILSAVPSLLESPFNDSILKRAQEKKIVEIKVHNIRDYSTNKQKSIDDYAFGGGAGMVLCIEPIHKCILKLQEERKYDEIIYMSPDGELLNQSICNQMSSSYKNIIIICGHYKGIDERLRDQIVTREISIGDYVLSGGELAAAVLTDAIIRLIPGVLNNEIHLL